MPETTLPAPTPMRSRLQAVWLTYRIRPMMWGVAAIAAPVLALLLLLAITSLAGGSQPRPVDRMGMAMLPGLAVIAGMTALALHAKSQFVTPNARLLPGYRPAHLRGLRWASSVTLVGVPLLAAFLIGLAPLGSVALALLLGAGIAWTFHTPRAAFLMMAIFFSLYHPEVASFWLEPRPGAWGWHASLLALGGWAVHRWWRRLDALHEERPDYSIPVMAVGGARASRSERAEQRKLAAKHFGNNASWNDGPIDRLLARRGLSCYALLRLTLIPGATWFRGVILAAAFCGPMAVLMIWLGALPGGRGAAFVMPMIVMTLFMPGSIAGQGIDLKKPLLETELLRPVGRHAYVNAFFRALLAEAVILGAIITAAILAFVAVYAAELILPWRLACYLVALPISNLMIAATSLWIAARHGVLWRVASQLVVLFVIALLFALCLAAPDLLESTTLSIALAVAIAAVFLAAGVITLRSAFGRWLAMEVG